MNDAWGYLTKLPEALETWGAYSWALLAALAVVGLGLVVVFSRRRASRWSVPVIAGALVVLMAGGGVVLKAAGAAAQRQAERAWIARQQARPGERRVVVSNLVRLGSADAAADEAAARELVSWLAGIVGEDLPACIPTPMIVHVDFHARPSPWPTGIDQANFGDVLQRLGAVEIVWGDLDEARGMANTFLGILPRGGAEVDAWVPIRDLPLHAQPGAPVLGDGYYRLLGHVALGIAVQTLRDARAATGEERKRLLLLASQQILEAQRKFVSGKRDPVLFRNLYDRGDRLVAESLAEAGVSR